MTEYDDEPLNDEADVSKTDAGNANADEITQPADARLYVSASDDVKAIVKADWTREYCYDKRPNEDYFHLIVGGEIYLQRGHEKYCLECALKRGLATRDRLNWQK